MDALRLSLLVIGAVVVVAIYAAGRYRRRQREDRLLSDEARDIDDAELESLAGLRATSDDTLLVDSDVGPLHADEGDVAADESLITVFNIFSPTAEGFAGARLRQALEQHGFVFGEMNIFHLYAQPGQSSGIPVCSVANAFNPGNFDLETMDEMSTRGITLFMQLPGALEGREAFERTLDAARAVATTLDGELCDETRSVLTPQTVSHLKEKVEAYRLRVQMARVRDRRRHST